MDCKVACDYCDKTSDCKVTCDCCGSTIEISVKTVPPQKASGGFSHVEAFLNSCSKIHITWGFDELQADAVHRNFNIAAFKTELRTLLDKAKMKEKQ